MTTGASGHSPSRSPRAEVARACALVAAGGAVGTVVRAVVGDVFPPGASGIPWSTLAINLLGALVLGFLLELLLGGPTAGLPRSPRAPRSARGARSPRDAGWRGDVWLACGTGLLGGFTTYSAFVLQAGELASGGRPALAAGYAVGSVALGLVAAGAGLSAAGLSTGRRRHRPEPGGDA